MKVDRQVFVMVAALLCALPGTAWGVCELGLNDLAAGRAPGAIVIDTCDHDFAKAGEARLLGIVRQAVAAKNRPQIQLIKSYSSELYKKYSSPTVNHQGDSVLASLRRILITAGEGYIPERGVPSEDAITISQVEALFDSLASAIPSPPGPEGEDLDGIRERLEKVESRLSELESRGAVNGGGRVGGGNPPKDELALPFAVMLVIALIIAGSLVLVDRRLRGEIQRARVERANFGPPLSLRRVHDHIDTHWKPRIESAGKQLEDRLSKRLDTLTTELDGAREKLANFPSSTDKPKNETDSLHRLEEKIKSLEERERIRQESPPPPAPDPVELELAILKSAWKKFAESESNKELAEALAKEESMPIQDDLLVTLPKLFSNDQELKSAFDAAVAPARDFVQLVSRLSFIYKRANKKADRLEDQAKELLRLREGVQLLSMIQSSGFMADRLRFRLDRWVADRFVGFADLFIQRFQQAQLAGNLDGWQEGLPIVRRYLEMGDVVPISIELGSTCFDSAQHVGRSTASNPRMKNGAIAGVIRNGFLRRSTGQVVRQPEVIVNRI